MRPFLSAVAVLAACATAGAAIGAAASQTISVTQKRRTFSPSAVTIAEGDTIAFVNDDGELLHHAYSRSPDFSFDIGEQGAGSRVAVRFPKAGVYQVRCDIHPRMLLEVTVK